MKKIANSKKNTNELSSSKKNINNNIEPNKIKQYVPASFNRRFFSRLIDFIFVGFFTLFFLFISIVFFVGNQTAADNQYSVDVCLKLSSQEILDDNRCDQYVKENLEYLNYGLLVSYAFTIGYFTLLPLTKIQSTLGKRMLNLKIVDKNNLLKINYLQSFTREIFWTIGILLSLINFYFSIPFLSQADTILIAIITFSAFQIPFNKYKQAWHDKLASTLVIKDITKSQETKSLIKTKTS